MESISKDDLIKCRDTLLETNCKMQICGAIQSAYFILGYKDRIVFIDNYEDNISIKEDLLNELNLLIGDFFKISSDEKFINTIIDKYKSSSQNETNISYMNTLLEIKEEFNKPKNLDTQKQKIKRNN